MRCFGAVYYSFESEYEFAGEGEMDGMDGMDWFRSDAMGM